jgi:hypothetical protein
MQTNHHEAWLVLYSDFQVEDLLIKASADFHFKRRGKISDGVQAAPALSELQQGLGVWVKAFHTK